MRSPLSEKAQRDLLKASRRLTPAQRLEAFAEHSRLHVLLNQAGRRRRSRNAKKS